MGAILDHDENNPTPISTLPISQEGPGAPNFHQPHVASQPDSHSHQPIAVHYAGRQSPPMGMEADEMSSGELSDLTCDESFASLGPAGGDYPGPAGFTICNGVLIPHFQMPRLGPTWAMEVKNLMYRSKRDEALHRRMLRPGKGGKALQVVATSQAAMAKIQDLKKQNAKLQRDNDRKDKQNEALEKDMARKERQHVTEVGRLAADVMAAQEGNTNKLAMEAMASHTTKAINHAKKNPIAGDASDDGSQSSDGSLVQTNTATKKKTKTPKKRKKQATKNTTNRKQTTKKKKRAPGIDTKLAEEMEEVIYSDSEATIDPDSDSKKGSGGSNVSFHLSRLFFPHTSTLFVNPRLLFFVHRGLPEVAIRA